jgi:muramoyltetrapeptide carboxypeptidase
MGFKVVEGPLTASEKSQGYRSGTPKERAEEFMTLIGDPNVKCLISTIGGANSSSMIPFLDFDLIRAKPNCWHKPSLSNHKQF